MDTTTMSVLQDELDMLRNPVNHVLLAASTDVETPQVERTRKSESVSAFLRSE